MQRPWLVAAVAAALMACSSGTRGGVANPRFVSAGDGPARNTLVVGSRWDPNGRLDGYYQGDRKLSLDEFLLISGHEDAVDHMANRRILRGTLVAVGALAIIGGAAYALSVDACSRAVPVDEYQACQSDRNRQWTYGALGAVGGLAIGGVGYWIGDGRPGNAQLMQWAGDYNQAHGLPGIGATAPQVTAAVGPDGARLVIRGGF